jgi:large subunit ribosomal protein L6
MSRVGKLPVKLQKGVEAKLDGRRLTVKGPKGTLMKDLPEGVNIDVGEEAIVVTRLDESRKSRALHGLVRALINNLVVGVTEGFSRDLELQGVGYRADVQGNILNLSVGYSHPVRFALPDGISASMQGTGVIRLQGINKELLGQTAANVRAVRPVEPYKGKGIRYAGEYVIRKAGKAGKK